MRGKGKGRKNPKAGKIGEYPNTSTSKRHEIDTGHGIVKLETKRLYCQELTYIDESDASDMHKRTNKTITISGFKTCFEILNLQQQKLYWHYAIVAYNDIPTAPLTTGLANAGNDPQTNPTWFRSQSGDTRSTNMNDSRTGIECNCLPINTDEFTVLAHKKFWLGPSAGSNNNGDAGTNYRTVEHWTPLNRQIRYRNSGASSAAEKIFLVHWCSTFGETPGTNNTNVMDVVKHVTTFFREPYRS